MDWLGRRGLRRGLGWRQQCLGDERDERTELESDDEREHGEIE